MPALFSLHNITEILRFIFATRRVWLTFTTKGAVAYMLATQLVTVWISFAVAVWNSSFAHFLSFISL